MRPIAIFALAISFGVQLSAEEQGPIELSLEPRAIEAPVLKYRLLPAEAEIVPGNAVPILLRLPWEQTPWMTKVYPTLDEWTERPLSAPEWETSGGVLPENFYREIKRAAFRRDAIWEYPILETQTPYLILLPDVQGLRGFLGRGLSARIRYHLSRGELAEAREGILVGLANGRHLAQTPFLVNQLVAIAIDRNMLERTGELIAQPNSPNLYWALSALPDSLIELDRAASMESGVFALTIPAANDLDRPRDAEEWRQMAAQLITLLEELGELPRPDRSQAKGSLLEQFFQRLSLGGNPYLAKWTEHAREELPEMLGIDAEKVAAMSDDEAAVRWYIYLRLNRDQRTAATLTLPPREAWPLLVQLKAEIEDMEEKTGAKEQDVFHPLTICLAVWTLDRKIQSLRIVEAVRHHLASHDGQFPATLDEIAGVSIPLDPLTDQPFEWHVDGTTATLKAPPLPAAVVDPNSDTARANVLEYRLRMK